MSCLAGSVSVTPTTGIFACSRDPHHALCRGVARLAVIEQQTHLVLPQIILEGGDIGCARLGIVHHRKLEALVAHLETERRRQ